MNKETDGETQSYVIDDGSGRISLRFFETNTNLEVGDMITVIGKPREFGAERYLVPEIIRKVINPKWAELRKLELEKEKQKEPKAQPIQEPTRNLPEKKEISEDELAVESEDLAGEPEETQETKTTEENKNPLTKIFETIKRLDEGAGVGFDQIIVETNIDTIDIHIKKLLEQGDIFEIRPGRYKVLE